MRHATMRARLGVDWPTPAYCLIVGFRFISQTWSYGRLEMRSVRIPDPEEGTIRESIIVCQINLNKMHLLKIYQDVLRCALK